jgi:hypothetical protein
MDKILNTSIVSQGEILPFDKNDENFKGVG